MEGNRILLDGRFREHDQMGFRLVSPPPGQPGMFALSGTGVLEGIYRQVGFRDMAIHRGTIRRSFPSLDDALQSIKSSSAALHDLMNNLSDADRGRAWKEIEQGLRRFERTNGFDSPGEVLIGVGTK